LRKICKHTKVIHDKGLDKSGYKIKVWFQENDSYLKLVDAIRFSEDVLY
jgi:hypothetical protein